MHKSSFPPIIILLIYYSYSSGNIIHISSVLLSQFSLAFDQSLDLSSYHSSVSED